MKTITISDEQALKLYKQALSAKKTIKKSLQNLRNEKTVVKKKKDTASEVKNNLSDHLIKLNELIGKLVDDINEIDIILSELE